MHIYIYRHLNGWGAKPKRKAFQSIVVYKEAVLEKRRAGRQKGSVFYELAFKLSA